MKYLNDWRTLVERLPATNSVCDASIILIRLDPRCISFSEKFPTERSLIIDGEKIDIIEPIIIKRINVTLIIEEEALKASSSSFFNKPANIGIKTVDTAPTINIE